MLRLPRQASRNASCPAQCGEKQTGARVLCGFFSPAAPTPGAHLQGEVGLLLPCSPFYNNHLLFHLPPASTLHQECRADTRDAQSPKEEGRVVRGHSLWTLKSGLGRGWSQKKPIEGSMIQRYEHKNMGVAGQSHPLPLCLECGPFRAIS